MCPQNIRIILSLGREVESLHLLFGSISYIAEHQARMPKPRKLAECDQSLVKAKKGEVIRNKISGRVFFPPSLTHCGPESLKSIEGRQKHDLIMY